MLAPVLTCVVGGGRRLAKLMEKLRQELDEWEKREGAPFDR